MQSLQGIAVSPGVAIGDAFVIDNEGFRIPRRFVSRDAVEDELDRLNAAIDGVAGGLEENRDKVSRQLGDQYGAIFSAHLMMLRDPHLTNELVSMVRDQHFTPEYAVSSTLRKFAKVFQSLENGYIADRADDLFDLEKSLLGQLLGESRQELTHIDTPVIVLAHNLTPSETARLDPKYVLGFVTERGGLGGHTAIVAEALEIPAVVGAGNFLTDVSGAARVIIDGSTGRIVIDPDQLTEDRFREKVDRQRREAIELAGLKRLEAQTADGIPLAITANIEFPHEVEACVDRGADGVGLYRTEFLYLGSKTEPSEEDHFQAYNRVVSAMQGRPVVIRTLDLGADKVGVTASELATVRNPFLGVRSIRVSLRNLDQFRTQLRAILRASTAGKAKVMFPLIATLAELRSAKMVLAEVREDLEEAGIDFDHELSVGMMAEVPSAVVMLDRFVREVDFVSIGTNDLVQYALAVDRGNPEVADLYRATDPAVLRLIKQCIDVCHDADVEVSMCGQMCGNPHLVLLLLGLGLRHLSVRPSALLQIKRVCREVTMDQCEQIATNAMEMDTAREIDRYLQEELRKAIPDAVSP